MRDTVLVVTSRFCGWCGAVTGGAGSVPGAASPALLQVPFLLNVRLSIGVSGLLCWLHVLSGRSPSIVLKKEYPW